ncbi:hypothetical protein [Luteimonas vadosa]|uniref:Lipoprotein n=1 Tax=Luteimonas vadosa TaxID=1165507 RepID=A0ABP9DSI8_9GAMM
MSKVPYVSLLALAGLGMLSCASEEEGQSKTSVETAAANVPDQIRHVASRDIGSICTLESINGKRPRFGTTFPPNTTAIFQGWARVADRAQPLPPIVYLVLRPEGAGEDQDMYLEMGRAPGRDQSIANPELQMIGFEGQATLPGEGVYEARVWQGTSGWGTLCTVSNTITVEQLHEPERTLLPIMEDEKTDSGQAEPEQDESLPPQG